MQTEIDMLFAVVAPGNPPRARQAYEGLFGVVGMQCCAVAWVGFDIIDVIVLGLLDLRLEIFVSGAATEGVRLCPGTTASMKARSDAGMRPKRKTCASISSRAMGFESANHAPNAASCVMLSSWRWPCGFIGGPPEVSFYHPLTAPAVNPAMIWRAAKNVNSSGGMAISTPAAISSPQSMPVSLI